MAFDRCSGARGGRVRKDSMISNGIRPDVELLPIYSRRQWGGRLDLFLYVPSGERLDLISNGFRSIVGGKEEGGSGGGRDHRKSITNPSQSDSKSFERIVYEPSVPRARRFTYPRNRGHAGLRTLGTEGTQGRDEKFHRDTNNETGSML